jgi:hypothetical protein
MIKWMPVFLGLALFSATTAFSRDCDEPAEKRQGREEMDKRKEDWKKLSPEEREAKRKEIKARLEKRIADLRSKQTNATITAQETRELGRSEQILKRFEQQNAAGRAERPKVAEPAAPDPK